jgi:hypothetical protein
MTNIAKAALVSAFLLALGACQVNVDNKTQAQIDNASDDVGNTIDSAAAGVANTADQVGNAVEAGADKIGNTHVNVDLHGNDNSSSNAAANKQ